MPARAPASRSVRLQSTVRQPIMPVAAPLPRPGSILSSPRAARILRLLSAAARRGGRAVLRRCCWPIRYVVFPRDRRLPRRASRDAVAPSSGSRWRSRRSPAGWDGWNPRLTIADSRSATARIRAAEPVLLLPRVDLVVAWTSLPFAGPAAEGAVDRPARSCRSAATSPAGCTSPASRSIPSRQSDDSRVTDWLLRQRADRRARRAGHVERRAARRAAARARPRDVPARAQRSASHRFGLVGSPPAEPGVAARLARRGDRRVAQGLARRARALLRAPRLRRRRAVARMDSAAAAGRERRGRAARRGSTSPAASATDMVADLELADVRTRLAREPAAARPHAPRRPRRLEARRRQARAGRQGLDVHDARGQELPPTAFTSCDDRGRRRRDHRRAACLRPPRSRDRCRRSPTHLPLPEGWRRDLAALALRGSVSNGKFAGRARRRAEQVLRQAARFSASASPRARRARVRPACPATSP